MACLMRVIFRAKDYMDLHNVIYDKGDGSTEEDVFSKEVVQAVQGVTIYIKSKIWKNLP